MSLQEPEINAERKRDRWINSGIVFQSYSIFLVDVLYQKMKCFQQQTVKTVTQMNSSKSC